MVFYFGVEVEDVFSLVESIELWVVIFKVLCGLLDIDCVCEYKCFICLVCCKKSVDLNLDEEGLNVLFDFCYLII